MFRNAKNGRYYAIAISFDLFGDTVVRRWWGSENSRRGGESTEPMPADEAEREVERTAKLRISHGYIEFKDLPDKGGSP